MFLLPYSSSMKRKIKLFWPCSFCYVDYVFVRVDIGWLWIHCFTCPEFPTDILYHTTFSLNFFRLGWNYWLNLIRDHEASVNSQSMYSFYKNHMLCILVRTFFSDNLMIDIVLLYKRTHLLIAARVHLMRIICVHELMGSFVTYWLTSSLILN